MLLGLLIAVRYSPVRFWPHKRFNIFAIHNWTGYLLIASVIIHPIFLLFVDRNRFRIIDILIPKDSPLQPFENILGALAAYLLIIVVLTSYFRTRLGRRAWKMFHYLVYLSGSLLFIHSIFTDPNLNGTPIDYLDGGKVFVDICVVLVIAASIWAWRYRVAKDRRERVAHTGKYAVHPEFALDTERN